MKLLQLFLVIFAATLVGGYELHEDDVEQYDDEVNDFDDIMHRDVDETDDDQDKISAELKSLKKDELQQVMEEEVNKENDFGNSVQDPWGRRRRHSRRRRRRRRWLRVRGRKIFRVYKTCCKTGLCRSYCFG